MLEFWYVAVNQGFTHKIKHLTIDHSCITWLTISFFFYLSLFGPPFMFMMSLMKHWFIGEGCLQRNIAVRLHKEPYRNCSIICNWPTCIWNCLVFVHFWICKNKIACMKSCFELIVSIIEPLSPCAFEIVCKSTIVCFNVTFLWTATLLCFTFHCVIISFVKNLNRGKVLHSYS